MIMKNLFQSIGGGVSDCAVVGVLCTLTIFKEKQAENAG